MFYRAGWYYIILLILVYSVIPVFHSLSLIKMTSKYNDEWYSGLSNLKYPLFKCEIYTL